MWLERGSGGLLALFSAAGLPDDVTSSLPGVLLGLAYATGLWNAAYRRLFVWRRAPELFVPTHVEVRADGSLDTGEFQSVNTRWEAWSALIPLDDMLVLLASAKGSTNTGLLPKWGLEDQPVAGPRRPSDRARPVASQAQEAAVGTRARHADG